MRGKLLSFQRETQREAYSHIIVKAFHCIREGKSVGHQSLRNFSFFSFFSSFCFITKKEFQPKYVLVIHLSGPVGRSTDDDDGFFAQEHQHQGALCLLCPSYLFVSSFFFICACRE